MAHTERYHRVIGTIDNVAELKEKGCKVQVNAYSEVVEDGHPILIVTATDIASILRSNAINSSNIDQWLRGIDERDSRLLTYYSKLSEMQRKNT